MCVCVGGGGGGWGGGGGGGGGGGYSEVFITGRKEVFQSKLHSSVDQNTF